MGLKVLLVATHNGQSLDEQVHHSVTAVRSLTSVFDVAVTGHHIDPIIADASRIDGAQKVLVVTDLSLDKQLAEPVTQALSPLVALYDLVVFSSNTTTKNILPRLAAVHKISPITDVCEVLSKRSFKRPIYAGNIIETVSTKQPKVLISIRAASYQRTPLLDQASGKIVHKPCAALKKYAEYKKSIIHKQDRPDLAAAKIVISGGRGLGSAADFKLVYRLADQLNAAVGASRAAVDAGFVSNDYQVGQTGKIIAPSVYVAVGISGAIQHMAGMKDSRIIVAINNDEDAPIFTVCDYGLVGDLFTVVPKMISHIKKRNK